MCVWLLSSPSHICLSHSRMLSWHVIGFLLDTHSHTRELDSCDFSDCRSCRSDGSRLSPRQGAVVEIERLVPARSGSLLSFSSPLLSASSQFSCPQTSRRPQRRRREKRKSKENTPKTWYVASPNRVHVCEREQMKTRQRERRKRPSDRVIIRREAAFHAAILICVYV